MKSNKKKILFQTICQYSINYEKFIFKFGSFLVLSVKIWIIQYGDLFFLLSSIIIKIGFFFGWNPNFMTFWSDMWKLFRNKKLQFDSERKTKFRKFVAFDATTLNQAPLDVTARGAKNCSSNESILFEKRHQRGCINFHYFQNFFFSKLQNSEAEHWIKEKVRSIERKK